MKRRTLKIKNIENNVYFKRDSEFFLELVQIFSEHRNGCLILKSKKYSYLRNWVDEQLPLLNDDFYVLSTKCYWIFNGLTDFPICRTCKTSDNFKKKNVKVHEGYHTFCCKSCAQLDPITNQHKKEGCMRSMGVEHPLQSKSAMKKYHDTCMNKYGVDHNFKAEECILKREQTWLNNYGVKNPNSSDEIKEKKIKHFNETYGVDNPSQIEQVKVKKEQTFLERYGVKNYTQCEDYIIKSQETCQKKYGVNHYSQSNEFKNTIHKKYFYDNTYFDSAPELAYYIWLKDNNIDFQYQPDKSFEYEYNDKIHKYFPDFEVNGQYVELKGDQFLKEDGSWRNPFDSTQDELYEAKHQCLLKNNVIIMYHDQYIKFVDYVKYTRGSSFLKQYKCCVKEFCL